LKILKASEAEMDNLKETPAVPLSIPDNPTNPMNIEPRTLSSPKIPKGSGALGRTASEASNNVFRQSRNIKAMYGTDAKLQAFLHLLPSSLSRTTTKSSRSNSHGLGAEAEVLPFTSVPPSMARRTLQAQGVSFLDAQIATIASIAADKFIATLLAQAIACRSHRLKGGDVIRMQQAEQQDYQLRRRTESINRLSERKRKEQSQLDAKRELIRAHRAWVIANRDKSKRKKDPIASLQHTMMNAFDTVRSMEFGAEKSNKATGPTSKSIKKPDKLIGEADDKENKEDNFETAYGDNEDSLFLHGDETDGIAQRGFDGETGEEEEEDESRFSLQIRDVVNPLLAWGVNLTGKIGVAAPSGKPLRPTTDILNASSCWHTIPPGFRPTGNEMVWAEERFEWNDSSTKLTGKPKVMEHKVSPSKAVANKEAKGKISNS
jgi:hypothetical protein